MATENILMYCVKKGGDRQKLRETIRQHSVAAAYEVKQNGKENDLIERILNDKEIGLTAEELKSIINAISFTGLATKQARDYSKYCRGIIGEIEDEMVEIKV